MLKERRGKGGVQWTIRSALRWPKRTGSCSVLDSGEVFEDALDFMLAEIFHDVSFDNVHEDFHDSLDLAADEDTLRSLAASKNEHVPKNKKANEYEFEILEPEASDVEDFVQDRRL